MNCNSIEGNTKNCEFRALQQQHDPHVILECESTIGSTFPTYNLVPSHYKAVHRKKHIKHDSGVFGAIRGYVLATEENYLSKDSESVWNSIQLPQSQKIYLGYLNRPPGAPIEHLEHLEESLTELYTKCVNIQTL